MTSNKRGSTSSVSSSVESISLRLGISLTLGNTVVHQTSTITDSLNSSGNTDSSSSRGDSNASNSGSVSDNVGGVGNTDGGLGADLLGDVLAVLDGGGVDDGGDLVMALLLLVALLHLGALLPGHLGRDGSICTNPCQSVGERMIVSDFRYWFFSSAKLMSLFISWTCS